MTRHMDMSSALDMSVPDSGDEVDMISVPDLPDMPTGDLDSVDLGDPCAQIICRHGGQCQQGVCVCSPGWHGEHCEQACSLEWQMLQGPVDAFTFGAHLDGVLWNDPTILERDDGSQVMWLTAGDPDTNNPDNLIRVYRATSPDGLTWNVSPTPVFEPSTPGQWDDAKTETPSIIQDGEGVYHMYYSGASSASPLGVFSIGHATSSDGITWMRDPANPVLEVAEPGTSDWGVFTVAEPAAVFDPEQGVIRLYYVSAGGSDDVEGTFAILMATSEDGSTFTHHEDAQGSREPVWSMNQDYSVLDRYRGFSTPAVTRGADGTYHLVHDVVQSPPGQDDGFDQVAISYATSRDGVTFTMEQANLVTRESASWLEREVRAPHLVIEQDRVRIWFAGGEPLKVSGNPPALDWSNHLESFGYVEGIWSCE